MVPCYRDIWFLSICVTKWQKLHNGKIPHSLKNLWLAACQLKMEYLHFNNILFSLRRYFRWQNFAEMAWCMNVLFKRKKPRLCHFFSLTEERFKFNSILFTADTELALWQCCSVPGSETSDWKTAGLDEIWGRSSSLWGWWGTGTGSSQ